MTLNSTPTTSLCAGTHRQRRISSKAMSNYHFKALTRKIRDSNTIYPTSNSITVTSPSFASKTQAARHRMVYAALKEELAREGGIHALQLKTRTAEEEARDQVRETKEKEVETE
ncbi:BolA domain-containing protein [Histoplasma ohiense]|nr:BolA domain-containing protein [Histoplasma ohiense (nom. inval.)]